MSEKGETLTESMLAALPAGLRPVRSGKYLRAGCPFHGSTTQRSLSINEKGHFQCFSCGTWGYTEKAREEWKAQHGGKATPPPPPWARRTGADRLRPASATPPAPIAEEWRSRLSAWQAALPEAADYLAGRRIPLELVRALGGGVGMLAGARRLLLPHTDPTGAIVSLYGRRIDGGEDHKHHHLPGPRGWLNAAAANGQELWLTEGAFDALALMAAGVPNVAAIFGVHGIRWEWMPNVRRLVLAFDLDEAGDRAREEHSRQAYLRGMTVLTVTREEVLGTTDKTDIKDIAGAWQAGTLALTGLPAAPVAAAGGELARLRALVDALPDVPPAGLRGAQWMDYQRLAVRFAAQHLEAALAGGWTAMEVFGLPHPQRTWEAGALWLLTECEVREVVGAEIRAATPRGAAMVAHRGKMKPHRLPWDDAPATPTA